MLKAFVFLIVLISISVQVQAQAQIGSDLDDNTSLLIIDVQEFYFPGGAIPLDNPEAASLNCKRLLNKFRHENRLIVHIGHNVENGSSFHSDVKPRKGEKVILKDDVSAFNGTDLLPYLQENGIKRLVICGMQTHMCVEAAVRAAYDLGFECIVVHDACATRTLKYADKSINASDVHVSTLSTLDRIYATVLDTDAFLDNY